MFTGMESLEVVAAPSLTMLLGSMFALKVHVPDKVHACTQNFSAGMLLSAVAGELYPLLSPEPPSSLGKVESAAAITFGFAVGLMFMFGIGYLTDRDEEDETKDDESKKDLKPLTNKFTKLPGVTLLEAQAGKEAMRYFSSTLVPGLKDDILCLDEGARKRFRDDINKALHTAKMHPDGGVRELKIKQPLSNDSIKLIRGHLGELEKQSATDVTAAREALWAFDRKVYDIQATANNKTGRSVVQRRRAQSYEPVAGLKEKPPASLKEKIPWAKVTAVTVDGATDGLLIGLAFAANSTAGWTMSIATCIEMGFLGLSFCIDLTKATRRIPMIVFLSCLPPLALLSAGVLGTYVGGALHENPAVFVGLIAFSIVALLFLVTQELLTEARKVAEGSTVMNSMIFVGVLAGILLSKSLE
jgi:zinc transporter ZupT